MARIMTVTGEIDASQMGLTLPHEHVLVDFGGADRTGPHLYERDEVVAAMTPYVQEIVDLGVKTFVDCTPMYLARDPLILQTLSRTTGLQIVTNTGQYKEPFLPEETFSLSPEELAEQWIAEWENGIEGTGVRPGFIKTAVNPEPLAPIQQKVIAAAALTSRATGLAIGTHTVKGLPALQIIRILERHGVAPAKWIFIHAHNETDFDLMRMVAETGSYIELDGLGSAPDTLSMTALLKLLDAGFGDQVLLSHDAGWYTVGEPGGGTPRPYTHLIKTFIPLMREFGIDDRTIHRITVENPAKAFAIAA